MPRIEYYAEWICPECKNITFNIIRTACTKLKCTNCLKKSVKNFYVQVALIRRNETKYYQCKKCKKFIPVNSYHGCKPLFKQYKSINNALKGTRFKGRQLKLKREIRYYCDFCISLTLCDTRKLTPPKQGFCEVCGAIGKVYGHTLIRKLNKAGTVGFSRAIQIR